MKKRLMNELSIFVKSMMAFMVFVTGDLLYIVLTDTEAWFAGAYTLDTKVFFVMMLMFYIAGTLIDIIIGKMKKIWLV